MATIAEAWATAEALNREPASLLVSTAEAAKLVNASAGDPLCDLLAPPSHRHTP